MVEIGRRRPPGISPGSKNQKALTLITFKTFKRGVWGCPPQCPNSKIIDIVQSQYLANFDAWPYIVRTD
jgi:hypothetical protein